MQSPQINCRCVAWALQGRVTTDTMVHNGTSHDRSSWIRRHEPRGRSTRRHFIQSIETVGGLVVEDADPALLIAVDRARAPAFARRAGHAFPVQLLGDGPG